MCLAAILDDVVQEAGDGLVLAAAVLDDQGGDAQQVGDVGNSGALAQLGGVGDAGVIDGAGEALGERDARLDGHAAPCRLP